MPRIIPLLMISVGLLGLGASLGRHATELRLKWTGRRAVATIVAVEAAGERSINRARGNFLSDIPKSTGVFRLHYRFDAAGEALDGTTDLTYLEIKDSLLGTHMTLGREFEQLSPLRPTVLYVADEPQTNHIDVPLPIEAF